MKIQIIFLTLVGIPILTRAAPQSNQSQYEVNVLFHQDRYIGGDTAFFSVTILQDKRLPEGIQLLHIDLVNKGGNIVLRQNFKIQNGSGKNQIILPSPLEPGGYLFTLSLNGSNPIYEKILIISGDKYFLYSEKKLGEMLPPPDTNPSTPIEILGVNPHYTNRQRVEVSTHIPKEINLIRSQLAVRVINTKVAQSDYSGDQNSVTSQLNSKVINRNKLPATSDIEWKGKVYYKNSREAVPDSTHVAIFMQANKIGYDFYTRKEGNFKVVIRFDFYDDDKIFVIAEYNGKELPVDLVLEEEAAEVNRAPSLVTTDNRDWYSDFAIQKREVDRAFYFFKSEEGESLVEKNQKNNSIESKFQSPDITVRLSEYLIFPTMTEIIHEIIPALFVKKKDEEWVLGMNLLITLDDPVSSKNTPLLIIDGVMTKDLQYFLNMNPADVVSIKLIRKMNKLIPWGLLGKDGVVFVDTKNSKVAKEILSDYPRVKGLTKSLPYRVNNYALPGNLLVPDFRTSLYWNPELKIDGNERINFNFYTTDSLGEFVIQVVGETVEGKIITASKKFNVVFSPKE